MRIAPTTIPLLLLLAGTAAAQSPTTASRLSDTIPNLPELYVQRVAQFESEPVVPGRIVFLGNSITQGADWPRLLGDSTVLNRGIGGDISYSVLKRLDDITRRRPSKLFILIGINDIGKDIPDLIIADNVREIVRRIQENSPETKIYVQSVLPVNPDHPRFPQQYDKQARIRNVNRMLKRMARTSGATYVDLVPTFSDSKRRLDR